MSADDHVTAEGLVAFMEDEDRVYADNVKRFPAAGDACNPLPVVCGFKVDSDSRRWKKLCQFFTNGFTDSLVKRMAPVIEATVITAVQRIAPAPVALPTAWTPAWLWAFIASDAPQSRIFRRAVRGIVYAVIVYLVATWRQHDSNVVAAVRAQDLAAREAARAELHKDVVAILSGQGIALSEQLDSHAEARQTANVAATERGAAMSEQVQAHDDARLAARAATADRAADRAGTVPAKQMDAKN